MSKRGTVTARAGLGFGVLLAAPTAAQAEDIQVTNLNDDGAGSLRQALADANADADADRVLFKAKLSGEITLQDGIFIIDPVAIVGPGARRVTVDGNDGRIFSVSTDPGDNVSLEGLTLTDAHSRPLASTGAAIVSGGGADLTVSRMTIVGNYAELSGGGVGAFGGSLTIESSTISGNTAEGDGGGVWAYTSDLSVRNSTISGNSAIEDGGGVWAGAYSYPAPNSFEVRNSTVTGNRAGSAGGSYNGGGLYEGNVLDSVVRGSIVSDNAAPDAPDLDDGPWDVSFSLIGDTDTASINDLGGNLLGVDPKLKPLANNGGPTDTHAIKKSPAKNAGPSDAPDKDQRGAPRKGQADIGAYEFTKCKGVVVNRVGTSGKDKLKGTKKKDGMLGLGGNDKLKGKKGKDGLCGGRGKDKLIGGPGKDKFNGGPGKDKEIQ